MRDKVVYDGWLKVHKRGFGEKVYDILVDYDAVASLIINEYGEVLLVKQFRPSSVRETLEIPAGTMDVPDESNAECLARELKEEANLEILPENLEPIVTYQPNLGFSNSKMHVFMARINKKQINYKITDHDVYSVVWMAFDELERNIREGKIQDVKTIIAYLYIKAHGLF
jgi:ADP-ribose pyrophosphatase